MRSNKEIQVRIARFLMADKREQEVMMTQYGWAHRQVNPLRNDYKIDVRAFGHTTPHRLTFPQQSRFRAEIQSKVMEVDVSARK